MRDKLVVGDVLGNLLIAPVQIPQLRHALDDGLPIQPQQHPQHAVRGGMLRTHVQHHIVFQRVLKEQADVAVE